MTAVEARLGGFTIHRVAAGEPAPCPTLCKGCFVAGGRVGQVFADPASLDAAELLPQLAAAGVHALEIEGRQRSRAYVAEVVRSFRAALDALAAGRPVPAGRLARLAGRSRDRCRFACAQDPDGLPVETLDGQPFLAVDGVQTPSEAYGLNLGRAAELRAAGFAAWPARIAATAQSRRRQVRKRQPATGQDRCVAGGGQQAVALARRAGRVAHRPEPLDKVL